jgi:mRNA interferase HigB
VRVIAKKNLVASANETGNAELLAKAERWYQEITRNDFADFAALRQHFSSVDRVGERLIFNLGSYRLIVGFDFDRKVIYVKHLLTHNDYMRKDWK